MDRASTTPVSIRPANPADLSAITGIVTAAYRGYIVRIGKPPAPMLEDYAARIRAGTAWVAVCDGAVAGLIVLLERDDRRRNRRRSESRDQTKV